MQLQGPGPSPGLSMQGPASGDGPRRRYAGVRDEVFSWSKKWVGDYGHLSEPRFPPAPEVNEGGRGKGDNGAELRASSAPSQRPGAAHTGMSPSGSEVASSSGGIGALGGAIPGAATASAAAYKANAGAFMAWQSDLAPGNSAEVAKAAAIAQALAGGGADGLSPIKGRTITTEISTPLHSEDLSYLLAMDARTRRELLGDTTPGQDIATSSITGLSGAAYGGAGAGAGAGAGGGARSRPDTSARSTGSVSGSVSSIPIDELMRRMELEAEAEATSAAASGSKANNAARPGSAAAAGWGAPGSGSGAGGGGGGGGGGSKLSGEEERVWLRVLNQMADVSPGEGPAMEVLTSASIRRRWDLDEAMGQPPSAPYQ